MALWPQGQNPCFLQREKGRPNAQTCWLEQMSRTEWFPKRSPKNAQLRLPVFVLTHSS